ncbi:MAG: hypothetical protein WCV81_04110 [Microgenomates group bacterium]|jgi:hypothetical protein
MNKKLPLIIGVIVLLGGLAAFMLLSKGKNVTPQSQSTQTIPTEQEQETPKPTVQPKSLKDLLALGKTQSCTFTDGSNSKTSIFFANNKMRGDFEATSEKSVMKTHIIVDGQTSYMWIDGQTMGYKMSVDKATAEQTNTQQNQIDLNKQADYNCKDWTVDSSVFNLPTGINFTDLSKLIAPTGADGGNSAQCAACDTLQGEAKTQCKTALKCS